MNPSPPSPNAAPLLTALADGGAQLVRERAVALLRDDSGAVTGVTLVVGTLMAISTFLIGQWILGLYDLPTASLSDPDAQRAILGLGLTAPVFPLIGAALAVLFRSTAAAISAVLALIFTPAIFGAMLPTWWQENVLRYLPDRAIDSFSIGPLMTRDASDGMAAMMGGAQYLDPNVGALVTIAWLIVFLGGATIALFRRDV